eukprot:g60590.t1
MICETNTFSSFGTRCADCFPSSANSSPYFLTLTIVPFVDPARLAGGDRFLGGLCTVRAIWTVHLLPELISKWKCMCNRISVRLCIVCIVCLLSAGCFLFLALGTCLKKYAKEMMGERT